MGGLVSAKMIPRQLVFSGFWVWGRMIGDGGRRVDARVGLETRGWIDRPSRAWDAMNTYVICSPRFRSTLRSPRSALSVLQVALPEESPDAWTVIVLAALDPRARCARGRANATRGATADITAVADIDLCEYRSAVQSPNRGGRRAVCLRSASPETLYVHFWQSTILEQSSSPRRRGREGLRSLTMSGGGAELPTRSKHAGGVISRAKSGLQRLARRIALLVALTVGVLLALTALFRFDVSGATYGLIAWLRDDIAVSTGCAVLVIATAVATPLMLSTTPINIGAGAVYGVVLGTFVTLLGHVAGAWICYVWSRWWARDWISRKMRSSETLTALNHALAKGGAGIVMLSRLSPLFPFAMCSFCFGACNVGTWDYLMGTAVGLAPSTAMISWVGVTIQSYSKKGASVEGHSAADYRRLWGVILLTVVSSVLLGWRVKAVIKAQAREAERSGLVVGTAGVGSTPGKGRGTSGLKRLTESRMSSTKGVLSRGSSSERLLVSTA